MSNTYRLRDIFSRGMPTVTYVDRDHLNLEGRLGKTVAKGFAIIAITGPSKCGKTVLRRTVITDDTVVKVEGGQVQTEEDFWNCLRESLSVPVSRTSSSTKQVGENGELGGGITALPLFSFAAKRGENNSSSRTETRTYATASKSELLNEIIKKNLVLVIDDFHYIGSRVRASIVRAIKSAVFDGLAAVMLSVPYRAFDVLSAEEEMEGRFSHLPIPAWDEEDLVKIPQKGFPAMGLEVEASLCRKLAKESMGSPLLMQSLCAEICAHQDVLKTAVPTRKVVLSSADLQSIFEVIARDFGLPSFEKLAAGPQTRTDRNPRPFLNGESGDIYTAVLAAIAYLGAPEQITYNELRSALGEVLVAAAIPQKHEVTRSILYMCEIAKKMKINSKSQRENSDDEVGFDEGMDVPAVDWKDEVIYINDVFLRFYLRWIHRKNFSATV